MIKIRLLQWGILFCLSVGIISCGYYDPDHNGDDGYDHGGMMWPMNNTAEVGVSITPGTSVEVGETVLLDATDSTYSDKSIEWFLEEQPIERCRHQDICSILLETAGVYTVRVKVELKEITNLGVRVRAKSEDEESFFLTAKEF